MVKTLILIVVAVVAFAVMVVAASVPISLKAVVIMLLAIGVFGWSVLHLLVRFFCWWFKEDKGGEEK
ncbi:MAG: hypothetical protein IJ349_05420 [Clostridia bacterium]|nr:hypothetical protein [Clostridia bacterium]